MSHSLADKEKVDLAPRGFQMAALSLALAMAVILALLVWNIPTKEGAWDLTAQIRPGGWMAWTFPVALFFWVIASLLLTFTLLAIRYPETPRRGILRIETTRGDRLFISLLGTAFLCLFWLFLAGPPVWGGLVLGLIWAGLVFRFV